MSSASTTHASAGLAHHFESYEQQKESSFLGMWLFMVQEIMFFGGLFAAYAVNRALHGHDFIIASRQLDITWGFINTLVLLCSSFTMVVAVWAAQTGRHKVIVWGLIGTLLFGGIFLGIKYVEYAEKWEHHLVPGLNWEWPPAHKGGHGGEAEAGSHGGAAAGESHGALTAPQQSGVALASTSVPAAAAAASATAAGGGDHAEGPESASPGGANLFFSLYFVMTGMHALHMVVGMAIMLVMIPLAWRGYWTPQNYNFVEGFGLYWHFVDLVWIFLFPFLYLIGASQA